MPAQKNWHRRFRWIREDCPYRQAPCAVSRKFVYAQRNKAASAIDSVFSKRKNGDEQVLFDLPVNKEWLKQLILSLVLICHSSYRGVLELLRDLFDYHISIGTIHNVVFEALGKASEINQQQSLSNLSFGFFSLIYRIFR